MTWIDIVDDARNAGTAPFGVTWYGQPNDLIGGWCITTTDQPPGVSGIQEVADVVSEAAAKHIAEIHNQWLLGMLPGGRIPPQSDERAPARRAGR